VDLERIFRVVNRTVRGLHFKESGHRLEDGYEVTVHSNDTLLAIAPKVLEQLHQTILLPLAAIEPKIIAPGVFFYRFLVAADNPSVAAWALTFYDRKTFLAIVAPAAVKPQ
jgi:hypothetical protein